MVKTVLKILYVSIPILIILILAVDLLSFYSGITITLIAYIREFIILGLIFICYYLIKYKLHFDELNIEQNLIWLAILIAANFFIAIILNIFLNPDYSSAFPPNYQSPSAIVASTIMSFVAAMTLVPAIFIIKQLIFYKRKRRTALFFNLFLILIALNGINIFLFRQPVGFFRFVPETLAIDIGMTFTIILIFILSIRNEWITYRSRKKKLVYFFIGLPIYLGIASLFDLAYKTSLPAYSLSIAGLSYVMWLFLVIYGALALIKLLLHLPTARAFDRKIKELNSLYDLGRELSNETKFENLLPLITELTSRVLESNATWLELYNEDTKQFQIVSQRNLSQEQQNTFPLTELSGLNQAIVNEEDAILINDLPHNRRHSSLVEWKNDARSILGAPLFSNRGNLMGLIYATKSKEYTFDVDDASLIQGVANQASIALENVKLLEKSIERERLEQELKVARDVQLKLLPQSIPQLLNFDLDAFCLSAYEVGGDYYDFFKFSDGKPGIIIGDVSGKGTSAALYMAEFKGIAQTLAKQHETPYKLACEVNQAIYPNIERTSFVSAIFAKVDEESHKISFARAGHTPVIYCPGNGDKPQNYTTGGIGIGLDPGNKFNKLLEERTLELKQNSSVIFYTDGVIEARNAVGEEFSEERLTDLLQKCPDGSAEQIKDSVIKSVIEFCGETPLHDDLTFVIVKNHLTG